jgi:hypothetical protein
LRPEANVTGFTGYEYSMAGKWLNLLKDTAPRLTRVALLFSPDTAPFAPFYLRAGQEAGERLSLKVTGASARAATDIEPVMVALADPVGGGVLVFPDPFNNANKATIIALAAKYRVPAIYYERFFVAEAAYYPTDRISSFNSATARPTLTRCAKTKSDLVVGIVIRAGSAQPQIPGLLSRRGPIAARLRSRQSRADQAIIAMQT